MRPDDGAVEVLDRTADMPVVHFLDEARFHEGFDVIADGPDIDA
jgi:hypothetical protein